MQVILNETQVSDLFFNHEMPSLRDAHEADGSTEQIAAALKKEAEDFSSLLGDQVTPEWLIEDYNKRL